jgi:hypothetical protein
VSSRCIFSRIAAPLLWVEFVGLQREDLVDAGIATIRRQAENLAALAMLAPAPTSPTLFLVRRLQPVQNFAGGRRTRNRRRRRRVEGRSDPPWRSRGGGNVCAEAAPDMKTIAAMATNRGFGLTGLLPMHVEAPRLIGQFLLTRFAHRTHSPNFRRARKRPGPDLAPRSAVISADVPRTPNLGTFSIKAPGQGGPELS